MSRAHPFAMPADLRALLEAALSTPVADDQRWIVELLRQNGHAIAGMLWRMLGSEPDVLDAYQSAVCSLTAKGRDAVGRNPGGYFYRTAMNAGIEILRARRQRRDHWPAVTEHRLRLDQERAESFGPAARQQHEEVLDEMRAAISLLPPHLRDVIILRDLAQMPYRQVARILGITGGTARIYRHQAILRLADLMGREADS